MLASDLNNPEFVGATNPDDMLHVEFFWKEPVSKWQSELQGKEVRGKRIPFVRMMKPGDQTSIHETAVRDDHKARWPRKWMAWQMKEGLIEGADNVPGWKIEEWDVLKDKESQLHEMKYLRFYTVEQIAGASDAQIQRLGIGGIGLREQAKAAIKERSRAEYKTEMEAKDKELADMRQQQKNMLAMIEKLQAAMPVADAQKTLTLPKGK